MDNLESSDDGFVCFEVLYILRLCGFIRSMGTFRWHFEILEMSDSIEMESANYYSIGEVIRWKLYCSVDNNERVENVLFYLNEKADRTLLWMFLFVRYK